MDNHGYVPRTCQTMTCSGMFDLARNMMQHVHLVKLVGIHLEDQRGKRKRTNVQRNSPSVTCQ